ncbi:MAG: NfeD family protein [Planctomycetota bacterium]
MYPFQENRIGGRRGGSTESSSWRRSARILLACSALLLLAADDTPERRQAPTSTVGTKAAPAVATLIPVSLPITGSADTNIKRMIDQTIESTANQGAERPILILEFRSSGSEGSDASEFERSLSIARYLASDRLSGVRTVAYLPRSVRGHAVLAVLACEEIIIAPDAELGRAGIDEEHVDEAMRSSYREIAERRRTIPAAVALGMLDKDLAVSRVQTLDGVRYVFADELKSLQESGVVSSVDAIVAAGDLIGFTGSELRLKYGFASHLASDRNELLAALELPSGALEQDPSLGDQWRAIRVDVNGVINAKNVNWILKSTQQQLDQTPGGINFVCVVIDSAGGSLVDSQRLASYLAGLDPAQVRTVAFVESQARGDAALIAWACNQLVMKDDAVLGGPGAVNVGAREAPELKQAVRAIALDTQRDWSLPVALVDSNSKVSRYTNSRGDARYFCDEELAAQPDPSQWTRGDVIDVGRGLSGSDASSVRLARHLASSLAELRQLYQIEDELEGVEPNWAHLAIEQLSSPQIAGTLLFIAWFALIIEVSQPGIGAGGFVSALCFILFFWSNFLNGTAAWLEGLLFVAGVVSLVVEIFVLPGFGIFGFGGACLVIASLVLASQTFIVPQNSYQVERFATSLTMVAAGLVGAFVALLTVRKYLPDAPIFKRMMLTVPDEEELEERELLADYRHLLGKRGKTLTQLTPSGKARFGDDDIDVISDGELVPRGSEVLVAEVRGNRVLVLPLDNDARV